MVFYYKTMVIYSKPMFFYYKAIVLLFDLIYSKTIFTGKTCYFTCKLFYLLFPSFSFISSYYWSYYCQSVNTRKKAIRKTTFSKGFNALHYSIPQFYQLIIFFYLFCLFSFIACLLSLTFLCSFFTILNLQTIFSLFFPFFSFFGCLLPLSSKKRENPKT